MAVVEFPSGDVIAEKPPVHGLLDGTERARALDISASWIVEAPAGSGKTGLLIQRFLKLVATVEDPAEVLALTFTQKATAEMRDRIVTALRTVQDGSFVIEDDFDRLTHGLAQAVLRQDANRGWRLLERPYRLNIRTIDSLCSEIARTVPLLASGVGDARPVRDPSQLYRRAAHTVLMRFGGDDTALNDAVRTVLQHRDGNLTYCERVLASMLSTREQWNRLIPLDGAELTDEVLDGDVLPRLNGALERTLCAALTRLHQNFPEHLLRRVANIAHQLASEEGCNDDANPFIPCAMLPSTPGTEAQHLDQWILIAQLLLKGDGNWRARFAPNDIKAVASADHKSDLKQLITVLSQTEQLRELLCGIKSLPPQIYPPEQWTVAKALFRLLRYALDELQALFAREEVCDFSAVALAARSALKSGTFSMEVRPRHLLVDEMQDTSSVQYELLEDLTTGWDGHSQTIFLVGDPKQSIYLFRQARVELFQKATRAARLGTIPLQPLRLCTNFRSGSHLVGEFNRMFSSIFPREDASEGDVSYTPATAVLPSQTGEELRWTIDTLPYCEGDTAASRHARDRALKDEAEAIGSTIAAWRHCHGSAGKIAVLTRSRTHVKEIVKVLGRAGIPFRAVEIEALGERQEVLDILSITRALLHPADRTAWLAVLRAPWCGTGVAGLFTLAAGDAHDHCRQSLPQHLRLRAASLPEPVQKRVIRTLHVMDGAMRHTRTEPLASRVERTWRSLGGDMCTDEAGRENVRLFLRMLDTMEAEGEAVTAHTLDARLKKLYAEPSHAENAIDIMTIHKAKGLEWDMVLVPGMHRASARDPWALLDWLELPTHAPDGTRDILLAPLPSSAGEKSLLNEYIKNTRKQRSSAEIKRLIYVAATRAKTSLQLFAWPELTKDGDLSRINDTLFGVPRPSLKIVRTRQASPKQPFAVDQDDLPEPLALAASEDVPSSSKRKPARFQRLAAHYDPLEQLHRAALPPSPLLGLEPQRFPRLEGSFGARAVGSVIHAFIERLLREFEARLHQGDPDALARQLLQELPSWRSAINATLSASGLPPAEVERAAHTVLRALHTLLESRDGRWLMLPHHDAAIETSWRTATGEAIGQVRIDRSFFAGPQPHAPHDGTLWIVDFKTGDHDRNLDAFLEEERLRYEPQLRAYAEVLLRSVPPGTPVMLALFYPLMGRLLFWRYHQDAEQHNTTQDRFSNFSACNGKAQRSLFE